MVCEKCGSELIAKNNPKYKIPNYENETHLVFECVCCENNSTIESKEDDFLIDAHTQVIE